MPDHSFTVTAIPDAPCELCGADPGQPCRPGCDAAEDWQGRALAAEADLDETMVARQTWADRAHRAEQTIARVREQHGDSEHFPGHCQYDGFMYPCGTLDVLDGEVPDA